MLTLKDVNGHRGDGERGQVLLWTVILLPLLIVLTGLVFDGGLMWSQFRRARWASDGAAVAAASDMDRDLFIETGQVALTDNALWTALYYARQNDPNLWITHVYVDDDNVIHTEGYADVETVFLGMFGVEGFRFTIHGRERPAWGISREGE